MKEAHPILAGHARFREPDPVFVSMIRTYRPPRQVGDRPWTPGHADYYHGAV